MPGTGSEYQWRSPEGRDPVSHATGPAMPRRPEKGFDLLASLPWPLCILLGIAGFLAIRYGIPWHMGQANGPGVVGGLGLLQGAIVQGNRAGLFAPGEGHTAV